MGDDGEESSKPLLADSEGKKEINNIYVFHIKTSRGAKRGIELHESTRNASRTHRRMGNGSFLMGTAYRAICGIQGVAKKSYIFTTYIKIITHVIFCPQINVPTRRTRVPELVPPRGL